MSDWREFVFEPNGGWKPESPECPYVEGVPIMAWASGMLQAMGFEEEEALAAALLELTAIARGGNPERPYLAFVVESAVRALAAREPSTPRGAVPVTGHWNKDGDLVLVLEDVPGFAGIRDVWVLPRTEGTETEGNHG